MNRRHLIALSGALFAGALAGCSSPAADGRTPNGSYGSGDPRADVDPDEDALGALVAGGNAFAFDLLSHLREEAPDANLFASPVSVSIALAMTYAGARGKTRDQMRDVLRFALEDEALHEAFNQLQDELTDRGEAIDSEDVEGFDEDDDPTPFQLSIVNGVWGQEDSPFSEDYLALLADHYGGGLEAVDFTADAAAVRRSINDWVAAETEDRIDELLPAGTLDHLTRLVLVNAVYFLANWQHPFEESLTEEKPFTAIDGTDHEVPMMRKERRWNYAEISRGPQLRSLQAVELPYLGEEVSMVVMLPPDGRFEAFEESFDAAFFEEILETLEPAEGTVSLPRFEFESGFDLGETLEAMGMVDAFDEHDADFSGMVEGDESDLFIHDVYHDAYVAVDEEGTEAAAATGVVVGPTSAPRDPFEFVADRPFSVAIRDRPTDAILFLGRVTDPAGWE